MCRFDNLKMNGKSTYCPALQNDGVRSERSYGIRHFADHFVRTKDGISQFADLINF